jgi:signal peptidase I
MDPMKKQTGAAVLRGWFWSILIAVLLATSFRSAIADWNDVPTGSMKPTIVEGDRIFVNKLAYDLKVPYTQLRISRWSTPQRGDIVVFFSPSDGQRLVKRVIGLPGDRIAMAHNRLQINGHFLEYKAMESTGIQNYDDSREPDFRFFNENLPGHPHPIMLFPYISSFHTFGPIVVPDGQYFVMGDNRDNSADSRYFGFVEKKLIVGRATRILFSLDYDAYFFPRRDRFLRKLS